MARHTQARTHAETTRNRANEGAGSKHTGLPLCTPPYTCEDRHRSIDTRHTHTRAKKKRQRAMLTSNPLLKGRREKSKAAHGHEGMSSRVGRGKWMRHTCKRGSPRDIKTHSRHRTHLRVCSKRQPFPLRSWDFHVCTPASVASPFPHHVLQCVTSAPSRVGVARARPLCASLLCHAYRTEYF